MFSRASEFYAGRCNPSVLQGCCKVLVADLVCACCFRINHTSVAPPHNPPPSANSISTANTPMSVGWGKMPWGHYLVDFVREFHEKSLRWEPGVAIHAKERIWVGFFVEVWGKGRFLQVSLRTFLLLNFVILWNCDYRDNVTLSWHNLFLSHSVFSLEVPTCQYTVQTYYNTATCCW